MDEVQRLKARVHELMLWQEEAAPYLARLMARLRQIGTHDEADHIQMLLLKYNDMFQRMCAVQKLEHPLEWPAEPSLDSLVVE